MPMETTYRVQLTTHFLFTNPLLLGQGANFGTSSKFHTALTFIERGIWVPEYRFLSLHFEGKRGLALDLFYITPLLA